MRLASYNVENLFSRARALNLDTWAEGRPVLELYSEMNTLLEQAVYSDETKVRLLAIMTRLGIDKKNDSRFVILREIFLANRRFDGLREQTGMSPRSLSLRLARLVEAGQSFNA